MNQRDYSEICFGLILKAKAQDMDITHLFEPNTFSDTYSHFVKEVPKLSMIEIKAEVGFDAVRVAEFAAESLSINEASEYASALAKAAVYTEVGKKLTRIGKKLVEGENGDTDQILRLLEQLGKEETGFITMADVKNLDPEDIWTPAHYEPIDANAGGLPKSGLTIIAGPAKLGKTTLLLKLLANSAKNERRSAFFSLEMNKEIVKHRLLEVQKLNKKQLDWIYVNDEPANEDAVYAEASRIKAQHPDVGLIAIDYASKMLKGRPASVESMSSIYAACGDLSKNLHVPVILIAGVSRGYVGGEVDVNHIWYSGLAEHEASLIILIHNPALLDVDMSSGQRHGLPHIPGSGYLKFGACRYGMRAGSLGAAEVIWNDKKGTWGEKTREWHPRLTG